MEPDDVLATLRERAEQLEATAGKLRDGLAAATATASSPDGAVTVTLSPPARCRTSPSPPRSPATSRRRWARS